MLNKTNKQGKEAVLVKEITINQECTSVFYDVCKRGIYKELNRKKLITDAQLNHLLRQ